jgi:hypothetical protein
MLYHLIALQLSLAAPPVLVIPAQGGGVDLPSTFWLAEDVSVGPGRVLRSVRIEALHWSPTWPSQTAAVVQLAVCTPGGLPLTVPQSRSYDGSGSITFELGAVAVPDTIVIAVRNRVPSRRFVWRSGPVIDSLTDPVVHEWTLTGQPIPTDCPLIDIAQSLTLTFISETR